MSNEEAPFEQKKVSLLFFNEDNSIEDSEHLEESDDLEELK